MGPKINDLNPILSKNTRPVAAIKSLRFALFKLEPLNFAYFENLSGCYTSVRFFYRNRIWLFFMILLTIHL